MAPQTSESSISPILLRSTSSSRDMALPRWSLRACAIESSVSQCRSRIATRRYQATSCPSFDDLAHTLRTRKIAPIFDDLTPGSSHRLSTILSSYLPHSFSAIPTPPILPPTGTASTSTDLPTPLLLPPGHEILHFSPTLPSHLLLPDGTTPDHNPGDPYTRRMWAGARTRWNPQQRFALNGSRAVCGEFIRDVRGKSHGTDLEHEKVFVGVERRMSLASREEGEQSEEIVRAVLDGRQNEETVKEKVEALNHRIRQRLWRDDPDDFGPCAIVETRNLVFMRGRSPEQAAADAKRAAGRVLKAVHDVTQADWTWKVKPDAGLLFRFSALTFNAHAIHLDANFARDVEGHRGLIVHGPLSYVLMMTGLRGNWGEEEARAVEYRNLAPLFCDEEMTVCGKRVAEGRWDVWILGPEGGMAVKGSVTTEKQNG